MHHGFEKSRSKFQGKKSVEAFVKDKQNLDMTNVVLNSLGAKSLSDVIECTNFAVQDGVLQVRCKASRYENQVTLNQLILVTVIVTYLLSMNISFRNGRGKNKCCFLIII